MSDIISMTKASFIAAITAEVQPLADRIRELEGDLNIARLQRDAKRYTTENARIEVLEAALHKAYNQFENITVADSLEIAKDRAHSFVGWAVNNLPGYEIDTGTEP